MTDLQKFIMGMKAHPRKNQVLTFEITAKACGEHCPEPPVLRNEGLLVCDKCYERWRFENQKTPQKTILWAIY